MTTPIVQEKHGVPQQFDVVAANYDRLVGMNPGYASHLEKSAERLAPTPSRRLLDLCCGTGLSTQALLRAHPAAEIVGLDGSAGMLDVARHKEELSSVRFVKGNAMDPRAAGVEGHFDGVFMAYGIRNLPDPDLALSRIRELLRPGGAVCFHEYSVADSAWARAVWNLVCLGVIIPLGLVTNPRSGVYRYLRRSVLSFDGVRAFEDRLRRAGFADVQTLPMGGWQRGIVHSFVARRPD